MHQCICSQQQGIRKLKLHLLRHQKAHSDLEEQKKSANAYQAYKEIPE